MKCIVWSLLLFSVSLFLAICHGIKIIDEPDGLQQLCNSSELLIERMINITVSQTINSNGCLFEDVQSLFLFGSDSDISVTCYSEDISFQFTNLSNLRLENLTFVNCGGNNSVDNLHFKPKKTAMVIDHCVNVSIYHVAILRSISCGLSVYNVYGYIDINNLTVNKNNGSGAIFYWHQKERNSYNTSLFITESSFSYNSMQKDDFDFQGLDNIWLSNSSSPSAGGLTIFLSHLEGFFITVYLSKVNVSGNQGNYGGGCLLMFVEVFNRSSVTILDSSFNKNQIHKESSLGSSLVIYEYDTMEPQTSSHHLDVKMMSYIYHYKPEWTVATIKNCTFLNNIFDEDSHQYSSVALYGTAIYTSITSQRQIALEITDVTFRNNYVKIDGACIYSRCRSANFFDRPHCLLFIRNVHAVDNGDCKCSLPVAGSFAFVSFALVLFEGGENVNEGRVTKTIGSVFKLLSTNLVLSGEIYFGNNRGHKGAVVNAECSSHVYLEDSVNATFENNYAVKEGGVFYAKSDVSLTTTDNNCFFQFNTSSIDDNYDISLNFINNRARKSGNAISVDSLYNCTNVVSMQSLDWFEVYEKIFVFQNNSIYTYSDSVKSVPTTISNCGEPFAVNNITEKYPGDNITVNMSAYDAAGNMVEAVVLFEMPESSQTFFEKMKQKLYKELIEQSCTEIEFYLLGGKDNIQVNLTAKLLEVPEMETIMAIRLKPCPAGLDRDDSGKCDCEPFLRNHLEGRVSCSIDPPSIIMNSRKWIGCSDINCTSLSFSDKCYSGYCSDKKSISVTESDIKMCINNRKGPLCGQCMTDEHSVVLGSDKCLNCNDKQRWHLIFPYVLIPVSGILLVVTLFVLKLTISTGQINGFIFYINAATVSSLRFITKEYDNEYYKIVNGIIELLNFNLCFPVCFYPQISNAMKTLLQFLFPMYLCLLVFLILLFSRIRWFAERINSCSVQVFATLIYLSYSKILSTSFYSLVPAEVKSENETYTVWFYDGTEKYAEGGNYHLLLVIVSLAFLSFIILPYTIFTTVGSRMMRCCRLIFLQHFIDAHHGPYKNQSRYWFGLRLWVLIYMFSVFTFVHFKHNLALSVLLQLIVLIPFTIFQAYAQPFQSKFVNIIDLHYMINICLNSVIALYFRRDDGNIDDTVYGLKIVTMSLTTEALAVFLLILLYHVYRALKDTRCSQFFRCHNREEVIPVLATSQQQPQHNEVKHTDLDMNSNSNHRYREPLIGSMSSNNEHN